MTNDELNALESAVLRDGHPVSFDVVVTLIRCARRLNSIDAAAKKVRPPLLLSCQQQEALTGLLVKIGSWTGARWDQHLRHDVGDEDTNDIIDWLHENGIVPFPALSSPEAKAGEER